MGEKNIKRLYETLARILSKRENVKITVNVSKKEKHEDKKRAAMGMAASVSARDRKTKKCFVYTNYNRSDTEMQ